jgi:O-antigen/teichoic acid export membrane protein
VFPRPDTWFHVPSNFWRFSTSVHANSVSVFAYQSIDQIILLSAVGTAELGAYFVLLQCAQLITFVPQRIGQVMLASFSRLVAENDTEKLCHAYRRLCRAILILSTPIALFLISFSRPVASIFGEWSTERHLYLLSLAAAIYVGTLGSVNSMLIMAKERTGLFLANSIVLITIQLLVSLAFVERWGAYAVIGGKACGILSGQIGLFSIVRWGLDDIALGPPREAWYGFATIGGCVAIAALRTSLSLSEGLLLFGCATALFLVMIRFNPAEILYILGRNKKTSAEA